MLVYSTLRTKKEMTQIPNAYKQSTIYAQKRISVPLYRQQTRQTETKIASTVYHFALNNAP